MKRISPTVVEIDLKALRHNFRQLKKKLPRSMKALAVVKSDAYGHGAPQVARALQAEGADWFGVGTIDEAIKLREAGVKRPIMVLLGLFPEPMEEHFAEVLKNNLTPVLYDLTVARRLERWLARRKKKIEVHVKIDTGMTRLGLLSGDLEYFLRQLKLCAHLVPTGFLTHLTDAGDDPYTRAQAKKLQTASCRIRKLLPCSKIFHLANSQATIDRFFGVDLSPGDIGMARVGIALYGAYPLEKDRGLIDLKPALQWKSRLVSVKSVEAGTPVSYGRKFVTKTESVIGVVPVGYADGYTRRLSNRFHVLVRGRRVPIAGTICMDMMMVDLTQVPGAHAGDEVVLIGKQGREEIRAEEMAKASATISYEVFCRISDRVPRIYV